MSFLRLRQICLVAADLEAAAARIGALFGLEVCHRDPNVAKYGLANVLFPVGTTFLEIVSPIRPGTTAGRFLERHGGRNGYMVILDCDDPDRHRRRAESLGIRVANTIRHDAYFGVQLHPKDTGAAMLEFNSTAGGEDPLGAYAPAGPDWQRAIRAHRVRSIVGVEIETPDPPVIAGRWASLMERAVEDRGEGKRRIPLDAGMIDFLPSPAGGEMLRGVVLEAADGSEGAAEACGVRLRWS